MEQRIRFYKELEDMDPSEFSSFPEDHEFDRFGGYGEEEFEDEGLIPDFVQGATNIYRTEQFIVKQQLSIVHQGMESARLISTDTYYPRTPMREYLYKSIFGGNRNVNGKRIPTMGYFRRYRD